MAFYNGPGGAGDATADAASQAVIATQKADEAAASASAAAGSASTAATQATNAANSATAAATSASTVASSVALAADWATKTTGTVNGVEYSAKYYAQSTILYEGAASTSASNASSSASAAATSASNASTSASNASTSATNAANSASTATTQATNASTSATAAAASASAAATSESNAATSATNASNSASSASTSATNASNSASAASTSASNAATSATNAANSATAAQTAETNAETAETNAVASASLANDWATKTSGTVAGGEYSAKYHAQAAATSASSASDSASTATTQAGIATTQASNALDSANAAAASYDQFDDRYLGSKTTAPSTDNDGNALLTGALYWNSSSSELYLWTGSAWTRSALSGSDYVSKNGDTISGSLTVNTDTTTDAVRITQTGTGNALVVEDSTNPDSTAFVIDTDGKVVVGSSSTVAVGGAIRPFSLVAADSTPFLGIARWTNDSGGAGIVIQKSRGTTIGSATTVNNGDTLGTVFYGGTDGTGSAFALSIIGSVDGAPATGSIPGALRFSTTAVGGTSPTERMRIRNNGNVGINTTVPAATLQVAGTTILSNVAMLSASYDNVSFSVATQETGINGLFFSPDGTRMYVNGTSGDDVNEYSLSTPWLISSATYVRIFSTQSQDTAPISLYFKADGLKMYVLGQTNDSVYQYSLASPWDVSTASYDSVSFSIATEELTPTGLFFKPDGLSMYVCGTTSDSVHQYTLSTAWNVSTATFTQSFSVLGQEGNSSDLSFTGDGTRMFVLGTTGDDVTVYNLTTPWDISTASHIGQFSVSSQDTSPTGLYVKPDGTKFYITGNTNDIVYQYTIPSIDIHLTGTTYINGSATVAQDLTVDATLKSLNVTSDSIRATGSLRLSRIAVSASDINLNLGNYFTRTISATTTFTVSNVPASGTAVSFILDLTNGGSATVNWWSNVKWAGGTAPTLTSSGRDVLGFYTHDGGSTWNGLLLANDIK